MLQNNHNYDKSINVVSLFSGCGGLDLGFKKAGFNIVWANDFDKEAVKSYQYNLKDNIICADIYNINTNIIPDDIDILIGGFPCLGFTIANGKNRNIDSNYNQLFKEYSRVLKDKQPE